MRTVRAFSMPAAERPEDILLRALALGHLTNLLAELDDVDIPNGTRTVEVKRGNKRFNLCLLIAPAGVADAPTVLPVPAGYSRPAPGVKLGRIHRKLLEKASPTDPLPAKRLISLAGYKDNSYSWDAITYLARQRLLLRTPDGYLRAS